MVRRVVVVVTVVYVCGLYIWTGVVIVVVVIDGPLYDTVGDYIWLHLLLIISNDKIANTAIKILIILI